MGTAPELEATLRRPDRRSCPTSFAPLKFPNIARGGPRESGVSANRRHLLSLGRNPGHFAKTIIREILSLALFDGLQYEAGDEFGLVAIGVIG
jgi:hypothetical protein